ncbi:glycosyltransferase [Clostridium paraputrificum]|uniref:glycosyltransferase n=1 Tax=Clostridium TaxID=1485 RepID=UPI00233040D8|nr:MULTISPECIES: glycosyltransferase [Clostridium]MDB2103246.1 glycosyltransferase [Clostridium paraputrificum]MDU6521021.1 glycosyltransferase [Clostridium sp.]
METKINPPYSITIIMSTYNGNAYIAEQLDSLLNQKDVSINLFVRDDGSRDNTVEIINSYKDQFNKVVIVKEENIGATASFHRAAKLAFEEGEKTEFYAFCDQDDIWLREKLITGINKICNRNANRPNLYFSNLIMVDNEHNHLGVLIDDKLVSCSRENALAAIYTYGCTCVFNRIALEKFCHISEDKNFIYHDNWLYSICSFLGTVYYDKQSFINYRQTGKNVSGVKKSGLALWKHRVKKIFDLKNDNHLYESIADELLKQHYDELDSNDILLLKHITRYRAYWRDKIALITSKRMRTRSFTKNICIMGRILLNIL